MKSNTGKGVNNKVLEELYRVMLTIRMFEERIANDYPQQEIKCPVHLCIGQEAIAAGVCINLRKDDYIFSTHRSHGHCIAKGMDLRSLAAELYGKVTGCAMGRGGSMHLVDPEHGIPGTTAIVGGCIPLAAGTALASKMRGEEKVSVAFFGDGAVDEGVFHESLNFASLKKLPVVFVCENNFYATNSPQRARQPEVGIAGRASSYGIPGKCVDGNNVLIVYETAKEAVERARAGGGPTLLEFQTYRWTAHVGPTSDIEMGCRPLSEYSEWKQRCPMDFYSRYLVEKGFLSDDEMASIIKQVEMSIEDAIQFAKKSHFPAPSELHDSVC